MTQNVSDGVDDKLLALLGATSLPDFRKKVKEVYEAYFTRNFQERATALAAKIAATRPHLIGLQEAILVRTQARPDGPATPATEVRLDYVKILLSALAARGLKYDIAVQSDNLDVEAQASSELDFDVRHTDREVILARTDLNPAHFRLSNPKGGIFDTNLTIPTSPIGPIMFRRGWVAVDVTIRGTSFCLISTHLDRGPPVSPPAIQEAQAAELLRGPATTELPVVLVGDFNSPAGSPTYEKVIAAGFADAAVQAGVGNIPTSRQAPHLLNPVSELNTRIDFVFFRGTFQALGAHVVGDKPADKTPSGFWPSDHAGVAATLQVPVQDQCEPIREELREVAEEISEIEGQLRPPGHPPHIEDILRKELERLGRERSRLIRELERCESVFGPS